MGNLDKVKEIFPAAEVSVERWAIPGEVVRGFRWQVYACSSIKLSDLKRLEELIGHDAISLVPADFEEDYSEDTPGAGFSEGYVQFCWKEGE